MKTKVLSIVAVLAATAAFAQTNQVLSKNAVGYIAQTVPNLGQFSLISVPFNALNPIGGPGTLSLLDVLPASSGIKRSNNPNLTDNVYLWNFANQTYEIYAMKNDSNFYDKGNFAGSPTNPVIRLYDGFWLQSPAAVATDHVVYVMGEVPMATSISNSIGLAFQFRANPYPVATKLDALISTNNGAKASNNPNLCDNIYIWQTNQSYLILGLRLSGAAGTNHWVNKDAFTTPFPDVIVQPGQAFWFEGKGGTFQWTVAKPYTWP